MKNLFRAFALLFALLLLAALPLPIGALEEDYFYPDEDDGGDYKAYSYNYEEGSEQAALHLHYTHAERGNIDLLDAFIETADYEAALYVDLGNVKIYFTAKAVSRIAEERMPVKFYVKEISAEEESSAETADSMSADTEDLPSDVVYEIDLGGILFDYKSVKIQVKHKTSNAEGLRVFAVDESGKETALQSAYGSSLVAFFPESTAFTLRITEEPAPEGISMILVLLLGTLCLLTVLSAIAVVLLKRGTLQRIFRRCVERREEADQ